MANNDSYVLTAEKNGIKVKSTIRGEITPERIAVAKQELAYRLEQLQPIQKLSDAEEYRRDRQMSRERYDSQTDDDDMFDDEWDDED